MAEIKKINIGGTEYSLPEGGGASAYVEDDALVINNSGGTSSSGGSSSGSGVSSVFEDVDALPDSPDGQKIYRVAVSQYSYCVYYDGSLLNLTELFKQDGITINIIQVSELPENPEIFMNQEAFTLTFYVMGEDLYGYDNLTGSNTWLSNTELLALMRGEFGTDYGGMITSLDTTNLTDGCAYIYSTTSHSYINVNSDSQFEFIGSNELSELENNLGVGRKGTAPYSEVFNDYDNNVASNFNAHAEGSGTTASGQSSHAEGFKTTSSGYNSHAEGNRTTSSGGDSHAEGYGTITLGDYSHVEGYGSISSSTKFTFTRTSTQYQYTSTVRYIPRPLGTVFTDKNGTYAKVTAVSGTASPYTYTFDNDFVTTEGTSVTLYESYGISYGENSHAEGYNTTASGDSSHTEGYKTTAHGRGSHAEGAYTRASGNYSHAEGLGTIASGDCSHTQGKYNIEDSSGTYAHIVGNGTSSSVCSNAHTLDWDGNAWFKGNVRVGGTSWDEGIELGTGSGVAQVFEDVNTLPENPDPQKIYRVNKPEIYVYANKLYTLEEALYIEIPDGWGFEINIIPVDELPSAPIRMQQMSVDPNIQTYTFYIYNNNVYGWFNTQDNTEFRWLDGNVIAQMFDLVGFGGVVNSLDTSTMQAGYVYLYYEHEYINVVNDIKNILNYSGGATDNESIMYTIKDSYLVMMYMLGCCSSLAHENGRPFAEAIIDLSDTSGHIPKVKEEAESILQAILNNSVLFVNAIFTNTDTNEEGSIIFKVENISQSGFALSSVNSTLVYGCFGIGTIQYIRDTNTLKMRDVLVDAGLHSVYNMNTIDGKQIQEKLVSGTNIKTINGETLLGSGDITISGLTEERVNELIDAKITAAINAEY